MILKAYVAEIKGVPEPEVVMLEGLWRLVSIGSFRTATRGKIWLVGTGKGKVSNWEKGDL